MYQKDIMVEKKVVFVQIKLKMFPYLTGSM